MSMRPKSYSPAVIEAAAKRLLPDVLKWLGEDEDVDGDTLRELAQALRGNQDGYAIARELEHWGPDAELVEILDGAGGHIWNAQDAAVKEWVKTNGLKLAPLMGATVKARQGVGVVTELRHETAQYIVTPPNEPRFQNGGGWIVNFEDCEVVEPAPTPTAGG